jgi:beta-lactam-binding protein with PASTA domain
MVPNVVGSTQLAAISALQSAGLSSHRVTCDAAAPPIGGQYFRQVTGVAPPVGSTVSPGTVIVLSERPKANEVCMPNTVGMILTDVESQLDHNKFDVTYQDGPGPACTILSQGTEPGNFVPYLATLELIVTTCPSPSPTESPTGSP